MLGKMIPVLAAVLLIGDGVFFGLTTNRWDTNSAMPAAVASLKKIPLEIGDWKSERDEPLDERAAAVAGFNGYLKRQYTNIATGAKVAILIGCGRSGAICAHTPEVCYAAAGYVQQKPATEFTDTESGAKFLKGQFDPPGEMNQPLHAYFSWNAGDGWMAPKNPRLTFAGAQVLYKLYVVREILPKSESGEDRNSAAEKDCHNFIRGMVDAAKEKLSFGP
jgi:Protein of unknown function (DUF3485)